MKQLRREDVRLVIDSHRQQCLFSTVDGEILTKIVLSSSYSLYIRCASIVRDLYFLLYCSFPRMQEGFYENL